MTGAESFQVAVAFVAVALGTLITELAKRRVNIPPLFLSWIIGGLIMGALLMTGLYPVTWGTVFDFVKIVAGANAAYKANLLYIKRAIRASVQAARRRNRVQEWDLLGGHPPRIKDLGDR